MFYDPTLHEVVLFGGYSGSSFLADTWAFNGSAWQAVTISGSSPTGRWLSAASGYNGTNEVLFGGYGSAGSYGNDTWVFTGSSSGVGGANTWTSKLTPSGLNGRYGATLAYDSQRSQAVLFGGKETGGTLGNDTWVYTTAGWSLPTANDPVQPSARFYASSAFDASAGVTVLFGGNNGSTNLNDTWTWDGDQWRQAVGIASPAGLDLAPMTYDPVNQQLVMAGGYILSNGGFAYVAATYLASHQTPTLTVTAPATNASGSLSSGQTASYVMDVGNPSSAPTLLRTVTDELPAGMSGTSVAMLVGSGASTRACTTVTTPSCAVDGRYVTMGAFTLAANSDQTFTVTGLVDGATEGTASNSLNTCSTTGTYTPTRAGGSQYADAITGSTAYHPTAYYRMDETTGSTAADSSGRGNTAAYVGGVTLNQAGAPTGDGDAGTALNGTSGYVALPGANFANMVTSGLDLEMWVKPGPANSNPNGTLFSASPAGATTSNSSIVLRRDGYSNGLVLDFDNASGTVPEMVVANGLVPGVWQLLQVRFRPTVGSTTTQDVEIDRDGAIVGAQTLNNPDNVARPTVELGALLGTSSYFLGSMDEAVLYQNPSTIVPGHYDAASSASSAANVAGVTTPVSDYYTDSVANGGAYVYKLGETAGTVARDSGGYGGNASYDGTIVYGTPGPIANDPETGITLSSSSPGDVNLATAGSWNGASVSIEAWIKPTAGSATGNVVSLGNTNLSDSLELIVNPANGAIGWGSYGGSAGTTFGTATSGSGAVTTGIWQQVDATIDTSGNVNLYVNGTHVGTQTSVAAIRGVPRTADYIGRWVASSPTNQFAGGIADVTITSAVFTAAQIAQHHAAATGVPLYGVTRTYTGSQPVCDSRLGLENWWSYLTKPVGDTSTAKVNVSNGNLVVEATDGTPVTTHGRLGYSLRRFYNSEETNTLTGPTAFGKGWQMAAGQTDDLTNGLASGAGLNVPTAETVANPLALTLIDRDGTHHTFDPNALTADTPFGYLHLPSASNLLAGIPALLSGGGLATGLAALAKSGTVSWACADQTYSAPPGVHLAIWRYLAFTSPTGTGYPNAGTCSATEATSSGVTSVVLGYVAERPDRLRDEYGPTGQLTDQIDPAGVDQRYIYDDSLTTNVGGVVSLVLPGLSALTGSGRLRDIYEPASCSTQVTSGSGTYTLPASCRALQFSYSDDGSGTHTAKTCAAVTGAGKLTACVLDTAGRTTSYGLDGTSLSGSHLTEVLDPDGKTTLYTYGGCGAATADQLCTITDRAGNTTHLTYTLATDTSYGFGSSGAGSPPVVTALTDRRGYPTEFDYYGGGGQTLVFEPSTTVNACTSSAPCEYQYYANIDQAGRAQLSQSGSYTGSFTAYTQTLFTWDTASAPCRSDNIVDNDLCRISFTGTATAQVQPPAGLTNTQDAATNYTYGPDGEMLTQTQYPTSLNLVTTWGYREQQVHTDGTTTCTAATPGGGGSENITNDTTTAGCGTSTAPVLYTLSDKTAMVPPRGNISSPPGGWAAYETTYRTDDLATSAPNAVPSGATSTGGVCSANGAATTNTGVLCETDTPASSNNSVPQGYCQASLGAMLPLFACTLMTYDSYGQKVTLASPRAVATAGSSSTIPVTAYVYGQDSDRDLTGTVTAGGWLKAVADPTAGATNGSPSATALTGHFVAYGYDTAGNIARTWDRNATTGAAQPVSAYPGTVSAAPGGAAYAQTLHAALGSVTASLSAPWRYVRSSTDQLGDVTNTCVNGNGDATLLRSPRGSNGTLMADSDCTTATAATGAPAGAYDTRNTYDANDEQLATVAPLGAIGSTPPSVNACLSPGTNGAVRYACTSGFYDAYGNKVLAEAPNSTATAAPYDHATATAYDAVNRPIMTMSDRDNSGSGTAASTGCPLVSSYSTAPGSTLAGYFAGTTTACTTGTTYDGLGNTISTTDGTGAVTWREYDADSRLTSTWVPRHDSVFTGTLRTDSVYDADSNVVATCPPREFDTGSSAPSTGEPVASGHTGETGATGVCSSTAPGPFSTATAYDPADHPITVTRHRGAGLALVTSSGYDADGNQTSSTDANGNMSTYAYSVLDRKTSMTVPRSGTVSETTSYGYDPAGDTLYTDAPGNGTARRRTLTTYDADNRAVDTVTGADNDAIASIGAPSAANQVNLRSRNYYDADGHVVATLDPRAMDGHTTAGTTYTPTNPDLSYLTYTDYDADGRTTATYSPRTSGSTGVAPDPGIDTTQGQQCITGNRPATVVSAPGVTAPAYPSAVTVCVTRTTFDATGNQASTIMPTTPGSGSANRYTATTYTNDNLAASVNSPAPPGPNAGGRVTTSSIYDGAGRVISATDQVGRITLTTFNEDGTQSSQTLPPNGSMTDVTTSGYDAGGEQISTTNAMMQTSTTKFNSDGTTSDSIDANGDDTRYTYDNNGNAIQVLHPDGVAQTAANPNADPVVQTFTADNLLASTATATTTASTMSSGVWRRNDYTYDDAGRTSSTHTYESTSATSTSPISGQDAGTQTVSYFPTDLVSQQIARNNGTGTCANTECITNTYDAAGNTLTVADGTGSSPQTVTNTYYLDSLLAGTVDGMRIQAYAYDGAGTESARSDGGMSQTPTVTADSLGDDDSVASTMDPAASSTTPVAMSYNKDGEQASRTNPDGTTQTDSYNMDGTLQNQTLMNGSTLVAKQGYGYDALKRVASQAEAGVTPDKSNYCYSYDTAGRLNGYMTSGSACATCTPNVKYDPDGNRVTNYDGTATSDNPDDSILQQGASTYSYDAAGRVLNDGTGTYAYDGFDRLNVATTSGTTMSYAYDGLDRQRAHTSTATVGRVPAGTTVTQSFDGLTSSVADETPTGMSATSYDLSASETPLAATDGTASDMSVLTDDGHGSIATAMNSGGACAVRYDPFGNPMTPTAGTACQTGSNTTNMISDLDYNEGKRDSTTGQYQLGSRTYNPTSSSYLTPDNYRAGTSLKNDQVNTDPLTINTYTYVNGDPLNFHDPDGHILEPTFVLYQIKDSAGQFVPVRVGYAKAFGDHGEHYGIVGIEVDHGGFLPNGLLAMQVTLELAQREYQKTDKFGITTYRYREGFYVKQCNRIYLFFRNCITVDKLIVRVVTSTQIVTLPPSGTPLTTYNMKGVVTAFIEDRQVAPNWLPLAAQNRATFTPAP